MRIATLKNLTLKLATRIKIKHPNILNAHSLKIKIKKKDLLRSLFFAYSLLILLSYITFTLQQRGQFISRLLFYCRIPSPFADIFSKTFTRTGTPITTKAMKIAKNLNILDSVFFLI